MSEWLRVLLDVLRRRADAKDVAAAVAARADIKQHGTVSHAEVKARLGLLNCVRLELSLAVSRSIDYGR